MSNNVGVDSKALLRILEQGKAISDPTNQPSAGFVIKTWDEAGSKVFINVCHSPRIPLPARWLPEGGPPATLNELGTLDSSHVPIEQQGIHECLCIPMVFSPPRPDVDHSGNSCAVFDCGVHPQVIKACKDIRAFKMHLIRMILRTATERTGIYLSPEFRLPKMKIRGVIPLLSDWGISEYKNVGMKREDETIETDYDDSDAAAVIRGGIVEDVDVCLDSSKISTSYLGKPVRAVKILVKLPKDVCKLIRMNPNKFRVFSRGSEVLLLIPGCRQVCIETNLSLDGAQTIKAVCDLKQETFTAEIPIQPFENIEWIEM
eukprot:jgi/Picsp_1/1782/NSC_05253-R1_pih1 domain-containing protein 1